LKITEYPDYKYKNSPDTNNWVKISPGELVDIYKFLRYGAAKMVDMNYFVICEDDIYTYNIPEYNNKLVTAKKKITIIELCGDGINKSNEIPEKYFLGQNFPNPFNPTTTICYGLPKESNIKLTIYDLFGRSIKTLINERQSAGYRTIKWDGKNEKGFPVSSSAYIYILSSDDFVWAKMMHLIR
jgi:hypothetical protein